MYKHTACNKLTVLMMNHYEAITVVQISGSKLAVH